MKRVALRSPEIVMRLDRLGALHQSRLSFMRVLLRRMAREAWQFTQDRFEIDANGVGRAVFCAKGPDRTYSLVAFAHDLPDEMRSDRVIAEAWDATFTLFDGVPTEADLDRLAQNVPLQEAGRITMSELTLARANRSVRLWSQVVDALARGRQPDLTALTEVGYLMRTTAVYGSGKFGAADRDYLSDRVELQVPFQAEMLTVFLIRWFVRDLVNHMAHAKGGDAAVPLARDLAERLGIGNSTGLGMAPFLINHPVLFSNWIAARETAIAGIRSQPTATPDRQSAFREIFGRACRLIAQWQSAHPLQNTRLADLRRDLTQLSGHLDNADLGTDNPWDRLFLWGTKSLSTEGQEFLGSLILEPYPDLIDGLANTMADTQEVGFRLDGRQTIGETRQNIERNFSWALTLDWATRDHAARAWYVSEEKLEPRLAERFEEPVISYEQPLAPARDAAAAYAAMATWPRETQIAAFLLRNPQHRHTIRRAQLSQIAPYSEIRDNTIGADLLPIDMLRAKLAFFGATHFDPKSDRWLRICMYQGAPYPQDLEPDNADLWVYPDSEGDVMS